MCADLVLYNGRIHTMDPGCPLAEAVAVRGNRILAVGDDATARRLLKPGGQALDLRQRTAIPGLIDAHIHLGWHSIALYQRHLELDRLSKAQILARVAAEAQTRPPGHWILGAGWNRFSWPDSDLPTAADLDTAALDHPVALEDQSRHAVWVNSRALQIAGITAFTEDPPGGEILREASGEPTGLLLERAAQLVLAAIPEPDVDTMAAALKAGIVQAQRLGLTGIQDPGSPTVLSAFQVLRSERELGLRALVHIPADGLAAAIKLGVRSGLGDEYVRVGGVKIFADGALGPRTAHMLAPYEGTSGETGIPTLAAAELRDLVHSAHHAGLSVAIHAIGDAANRAALDAISAAGGAAAEAGVALQGEPRYRSPALPDRIEHVQLLHPDDLHRFAELGVVASMQPIHATSDMDMAERHWGRRSDLSYAWRSLLTERAPLAFGSDCPVETLDPLAGIHAAVTRRRPDGSPGQDGWIPAQRLEVSQAVHAYTLGAAYASGEADLKGSVSAGKLADLVVLSRDIFAADPMEILETRVEMTVYDGRVVWEAP